MIGYVYILFVPFAAALSSIDGTPIIGGFRYTGWIWLIMLFCGYLLILIKIGVQKIIIPFPFWLWLPWICYVWLSLFWVNGYGIRNVQDALQITMPVVIGIVASIYMRTPSQLRTLTVAFEYSLYILFVIYLMLQYKIFNLFGPLVPLTRAMALTVCIMGCVFISKLPVQKQRSIIYWCLALVFVFISKSRMATIALLSLWIIGPWYFNLRTRFAIAFMVLLLSIGIFYTPSFQVRFFGEEGGTIADLIRGDFIGTGRFEAWPMIWEEAKKNLIIGTGIGQSAKFVQEIWTGIDKPHNDYLRIIFELGFIGLIIFIATIGSQIYDIRKKILQHNGEIRFAFIASYLGFFVLLLVSITDNPVAYNVWFTNPLFALLGSAYGVAAYDKV